MIRGRSVEVNRYNVRAAASSIEAALVDADFVAIDLEFTGLGSTIADIRDL